MLGGSHRSRAQPSDGLIPLANGKSAALCLTFFMMHFFNRIKVYTKQTIHINKGNKI